MIFNPTVTQEGLEAAFNADNTGTEIALTHIAFGTGLAGNAGYDPVGDETALVNEVERVAIAGGSRITPNQIRISAIWSSETDNFPIVEVGIYAGPVLFAVWSRSTGGPLSFKTPGVDFILSYDWLLTVIPPNSVTVVADAGQSAILALLTDHENDQDAHPQYLKIADVAQDASRLYWSGIATGTADAMLLTLPAESQLTSYAEGQVFRFIAAASNTGAVTVNINGLGVKSVTKTGATALLPGDIEAGAVYEIAYDGTRFQLAGGVGSGFSFENFEFVTAAGQTSFPVTYTPGCVMVSVNGRLLPPSDFTGTSGTAIVIPSVLEGQIVLIQPFRSFAVANHYTKAEYDAMQATQPEAEALAILGKWLSPLRMAQALRGAVAQATELLRGTLRVATQAETNSGTLDTVSVTPQKLRAGFSASFGNIGYIVFPSWLGGFVIQWGSQVLTASAASYSLPIPFPTAFYQILMTDGGTGGGIQTVSAEPESLSTYTALCSVTSNLGRFIAVGK